MKISIEKLAKREDLREALFHLRGLLESADSIREKLQELDLYLGLDPEKASECLGRLEAEILHHLPYHLKHAKRPFEQAMARIYRELDEIT